MNREDRGLFTGSIRIQAGFLLLPKMILLMQSLRNNFQSILPKESTGQFAGELLKIIKEKFQLTLYEVKAIGKNLQSVCLIGRQVKRKEKLQQLYMK